MSSGSATSKKPKKMTVQQKTYVAEAIIAAHVKYTGCCYNIPDGIMEKWQNLITGAILNGVAPNTTHSAKVILYLPKRQSGVGLEAIQGRYQAQALRTIGRVVHTLQPTNEVERALTQYSQAPILRTEQNVDLKSLSQALYPVNTHMHYFTYYNRAAQAGGGDEDLDDWCVVLDVEVGGFPHLGPFLSIVFFLLAYLGIRQLQLHYYSEVLGPPFDLGGLADLLDSSFFGRASGFPLCCLTLP